MTDRDRINKAFALLRRQGYVAVAGWSRGWTTCCSSCLGAEIWDRQNDAGVPSHKIKAVYFNRQNNDRFSQRSYADGRVGNLRVGDAVYLNWQGDASVIVHALRAAGLRADTPPDENHAIIVMAAL